MTTTRDVRRSAGRYSTLPVAHFRSRPDLRPPLVRAGQDLDHRSGDIFITAQIGSYWAGKPIQGGPMILDSKGRLVWFRPVQNLITGDLQRQFYRGRWVLTWWQGQIPPDAGEDVIVDQSYHQVATVGGAEGYHPDLHEFQITPRGTALVVADAPVMANLTSVGGPRHGTVLDCVIQELDIRTGKLLWEWHALGHIPLGDSYLTPPVKSGVYDAFHLNSIQQLSGHRLLISARNTWALYEIDQRTGHIIWRLGGKRSSFAMGPGTRFEEQHDARLAGTTLSVFDDADPPQDEPQSSAKLLRIDPANMTVSLAARYTHSPPLLSDGAGSTQALPDGDVFVGWGGQPHFSEYSSSGQQIFDASLPLAIVSYRAYRFPWVGQPTTRPALGVTVSHNTDTVYSSWNGATRVAMWRVLGGSAAGHLTAIAQERGAGFETAVKLGATPRYVAVQALDSSGGVLGTSRARETP
jgi:outer membrane protein assembly factor BamB